MSKNISLDEIKEFWPDKAPDINIVQKYVEKYKEEKITISLLFFYLPLLLSLTYFEQKKKT